MKKYSALCLLASAFWMIPDIVIAGMEKAPSPFSYNDGRAVFVDFTQVTADIEYDLTTDQVHTRTTINFSMPRDGYPIFDSKHVGSIINAFTGATLEHSLIDTPDNATKLRVIDEKFRVGEHQITIENSYTNSGRYEAVGPAYPNTKFLPLDEGTSSGVLSRSLMTDRTDRGYLERYIPANLQFDQYPMSLQISVNGDSNPDAQNAHKVFTNGVITELSPNVYTISFAAYSNTSAFYFNVVDASKTQIESYFVYETTLASGKNIPVTVYSTKVPESFNPGEEPISDCLQGLEQNIGPFPFDRLVINYTSNGLTGPGNGMEYSGAAEVKNTNLCHELVHQYFGRSVFPASGNDGWLDEAIASTMATTESGFGAYSRFVENPPAVESPNFQSTDMASLSPYNRVTDNRGYSEGKSFMAYLNYRLQSVGGLYAFLKVFYEQYAFQTVTTRDFQLSLEEFSGENFDDDFNQYIYGALEPETSTEVVGSLEVNHDFQDVSFTTEFSSTPLIFSEMQTLKGADPASVRIDAVTNSGFAVKVEEEQSRDNETKHVFETLGFMALESGLIKDIDGNTIGEVGFIDNLEQDNASAWTVQKTLPIYENPVVIAQLNSANDIEPAHIRLDSVTFDSFSFQVEEWEYSDGMHLGERIAYLVIEAGTHYLANGQVVYATKTVANHQKTAVDFPAIFEDTPLVLTQSQTFHEEHAIVTRNQNVGVSGFYVRLQEEQNNDRRHLSESVGIISIGN